MALLATVGMVYYGVILYRSVISPLMGPESVLRIGPDGVEHLVQCRYLRVPWSQVRRLSLVAAGTGPGVVHVETVDPFALVPKKWLTKARQNQQRHGTPVVVPLAGSGLTGADLLSTARHYAGDVVQDPR